MSQKEMICSVIRGYIKDQSLKFDGKVELTSVQKGDVIGIMVNLFEQGGVEIKSDKERGNPKKYFTGSVNNYLRKSPEFNGGHKYEPATKKGPRKSKEVQELEKLYDAVCLGNDQEVQDAVRIELDLAIEADAAKKSKTTAIDAEHIPESLRHLIK